MNGNFKIKAEFIFESNRKGTAETVKFLYVCDPDKNCECEKTMCGKDCTMTSNIQFAKRFDLDG